MCQQMLLQCSCQQGEHIVECKPQDKISATCVIDLFQLVDESDILPTVDKEDSAFLLYLLKREFLNKAKHERVHIL